VEKRREIQRDLPYDVEFTGSEKMIPATDER
jgi:hypothetical protein